MLSAELAQRAFKINIFCITGWFAVLQRWTGNEKADDNVPHFKTVEELANSNTDKFLIGGTKRINGLHVFERSQSQVNHQQQPFMPGDILTREKVYFGETKKRTRLFRKPKYITEKFLMCRDEADREILLPFEQKGIFYQVSERSGKPNHNVMQMSDIVARNLPPRIIKLVFGRFPVTPCSFTGLMKADTARLESSVITSTIINTKNILLEVPLNADMYFRIIKVTNDLKNAQCYKDAMSLCIERATTYMRNIKVCYNFTHKEDENIHMIKKESDMDLISSDEGNDGNISPRDGQTCAKKSSSLKRKFRKTKYSERNNNTVGQNEKKSSILRRGSKKRQHAANEVHQAVETKISLNGDIRKHTDFPNRMNTRFSEDVESAVSNSIRSARSLSAGRMSFCFGNSYLTVSVFASDLPSLNEDRKGSCDDLGEKEKSPDPDITETFPPPMTCTNIGSYVNTGGDTPNELCIESRTEQRRLSDVIFNANFGSYVNAPFDDTTPNNVDNEPSLSNASKDQNCNDSLTFGSNQTENADEIGQAEDDDDICDDYVPVSHSRRPSSKPPESAPPPIPSPGISENARRSDNSTPDEALSEEGRSSRTSAELFQYDVPKSKDPNSPTILLESSGTEGNQLQIARRPSTFTFTEGLGTVHGSDSAFASVDEVFGVSENSPIYENIKALQELLTAMEDLEINNYDSKPSKDNNDIGDEQVSRDLQVSILTENEQGTCIEEDLDQPIIDNAVIVPEVTTESAEKEKEQLVNENQISKNIVMKLEQSVSVESNSSKISKQNSLTERQKSITELTVEEFIAQLEQIGIRDNSLNTVKELNVDGKYLASVAHDDESLKECLPDVSLIDLQKISMFLKGWRPHEET